MDLAAHRAHRLRARVDPRALRAARRRPDSRRVRHRARARDPVPDQRAPELRRPYSRSKPAADRSRSVRLPVRRGRGRARGAVDGAPGAVTGRPVRGRPRRDRSPRRRRLDSRRLDGLGLRAGRAARGCGRTILGGGVARRGEAGVDPVRRGARLRRRGPAHRRGRDPGRRPRDPDSRDLSRPLPGRVRRAR